VRAGHDVDSCAGSLFKIARGAHINPHIRAGRGPHERKYRPGGFFLPPGFLPDKTVRYTVVEERLLDWWGERRRADEDRAFTETRQDRPFTGSGVCLG
jgi:hypothetical protein